MNLYLIKDLIFNLTQNWKFVHYSLFHKSSTMHVYLINSFYSTKLKDIPLSLWMDSLPAHLSCNNLRENISAFKFITRKDIDVSMDKMFNRVFQKIKFTLLIY